MKKAYHVVWQIEVQADTPFEAAEIARREQRDTESTEAGVFEVIDEDGQTYEIDLDGFEDEEPEGELEDAE